MVNMLAAEFNGAVTKQVFSDQEGCRLPNGCFPFKVNNTNINDLTKRYVH